jgi:murein DD-endopeptidase MepM/ murein hydrolase activator NlpD
MSSTRRTLVLIRRGERELGRLPLSRRRLALLGGGLAGILAAAAVAGTLLTSVGQTDREIARLRTENEALRQTNVGFEERLRGLQGRLTDSEDRARKLAIVAGLGNLAPAPEAGVGGGLYGAAPSEAALAALEGRTERLASDLERVGARIEENLRQLSATPSAWPVTGLLSSAFGWRRDPLSGQRAFHSGVDISAPPGRPVQSAASGVVIKTEQYGPLGRSVHLSHGFGRTTVYGHLARILVTPGQRVGRGETIGLVGNTGRATGYHLHYEVEVDGDPVNPLPYLLSEPRSGS